MSAIAPFKDRAGAVAIAPGVSRPPLAGASAILAPSPCSPRPAGASNRFDLVERDLDGIELSPIQARSGLTVC